MTDDFQLRDIDADTDEEDAQPIEEDEVPDVVEDRVPEDDPSQPNEPVTEGDST